MRKVFIALLLCPAAALQPGCARKGAPTNANAPAAAQSAPTPSLEGVAAELQSPKDAAGYFALGVELYKRDRDQEAVEAFKKAVELDPHAADAYRRLGLAYAATAQKKEAQQSFEKAAELFGKRVREDAKDAEALYNLADAYAKIGEYEKSADAYRRAVKLREPDAPGYYDMGLVYNKLAKYPEAVRAFEKAVELDPNDYQSREALDRAREDAGKQRERVEYEKKLLAKQKGQKSSNNSNNSNQPVANRNSNDSKP